jgi:thioredoxin-like negative regulator of GroEL
VKTRARNTAGLWITRSLVFAAATLSILAGGEAGLRTVGALLKTVEFRAPQPAAGGGLRVLCLGESTTAGGFLVDYSWPAQLQTLLDSDPHGPRYEIVNRGVPGFTTGVIADRLPTLLDMEKPQIVVTMMGVNDYSNDQLRFRPRAWENLEIVRVWRWARREIGRRLWLVEIGRRSRRSDPADADRRIQACSAIGFRIEGDIGYSNLCESVMREASSQPDSNWRNRITLAALLWRRGRTAEAHELLTRAIQIASAAEAEADARIEIADLLLNIGEWDAFERQWKAAWAIRPYDRALTRQRFDRLLQQGRAVKAAALARVFVARFPRSAFGHNLVYLAAAEIAEARQSSPDEASIKEAEEACRLAPDNVDYAFDLADAYRSRGRPDDAEKKLETLRRAKILSPFYSTQARRYYWSRGRTAEAVEMYRRLVFDETTRGAQIEAVAELLLRSGRREEGARLYDFLPEAVDAGARVGVVAARVNTQVNYDRIGRMLRDRGIAWIAMQYPLRPIENLKNLTAGFPEAVLVENRANFLDIGRRSPSTVLFLDHFAGDFGHCTSAGNRLIAQSAAAALRERSKARLRREF